MANGTFGGGTGLSHDPFLVEDVADFLAIYNSTNTNAYYLQTNDIDLSGQVIKTDVYSSGSRYEAKFKRYDGGGYELQNVSLAPDDTGQTSGVSLFGRAINSSIVRNLTVRITSFEPKRYTTGGAYGDNAGLFSYASSNTTIENVHVYGEISGGNTGGLIAARTNTQLSGLRIYKSGFTGTIRGGSTSSGVGGVGGLTGYWSDSGTMEYCYFDGTITNGGNYTGGLQGYGSCEYKFCYTKGSIISNGSNVGGLCGKFPGNVSDCFSTCDVQGNSNVGGLFGEGTPNREKVIRCYSSGKISGNKNVGGIAGSSSVYSSNLSYSPGYYSVFALNPSITRLSGTETTFGDFFGDPNPSSSSYIATPLENCYSLDTMTFVGL